MQLHGRLVAAEEIAGAVAYLAAPGASSTIGRRPRRRWGVHRPMIVRSGRGHAEIVMQVDHSHVAGTLASLWPGLEPRESVLTAAELHDIGWRSWEACPGSTPRRGSRRTSSRSTSACTWSSTRRASRRSRRATPTPACSSVSTSQDLPPALRHAGRAHAEARCGGPGHGRRIRRQGRGALRFAAARSLASPTTSSGGTTCCCRSSTGSRCGSAGRSRRYGHHADHAARRRRPSVIPTPTGCALDPYPLEGRQVQVSVPVRVVPLTGYANDADCASAILAAPIEQRIYTIDPREGHFSRPCCSPR